MIGFKAKTYKNRGASAPLWFAVRAARLAGLLLALAMALSAPQAAVALGSGGEIHTAGFRTMSLWNGEQNAHLEVGIWYPAQRPETGLNIQDWSLLVAHNAREAPGLFPLVLISHDAGGGLLAYHDTAADLARQGFVVLAPTHSRDSFMDSSGIFKPGQILDRPGELSFVLSGILGADSLSFIDHSRIAVLGMGSGAATALALAGGTPDFEAYRDYCAGMGAGEPYCSDLAQERFNQLSGLSEDWPQWPRPRISALVLAAPACGMFFTRAGLAGVKQPTLIFAPETDSINNAQPQVELIRRGLPLAPEVITLDDQDSTDLAAPCAEHIIDFDGLGCLPPDEDRLEQRQVSFNIPLAAFLKRQLGEARAAPPKPVH